MTTVATSTTAPPSTVVEPDGVAFWDAEDGLLVDTLTTAACRYGSVTCPGGTIERTDDGGRTWRVVDRLSVPLNAVAVEGTDVAWVTTGRCSAASPYACGSSTLYLTTDGGTAWREATSATPVTSVAPLSATTAWGVENASDGVNPTGTALVKTSDGGRTWGQAADPCADAKGYHLWLVGFSGLSHGWAMCVSQPATITQGKILYTTSDAGTTWRLQSDCLSPPSATRHGTLSCTGSLPGMQLLADGHGWEWADGYGLASTANGGRTWTRIAPTVVNDGDNSVLSASLVSGRLGFLLISAPESPATCPSSGCGPQLLSTDDAGVKWKRLQSWPPS